MPTIIVQGRPVRVSDSFFELSRGEQAAAVREIAEQMPRGTDTRQPSVNSSAKADRSDPATMAPAWRDGFGLPAPHEASNSERKSDRELSQPGHSWSELPGNIVPSAVNTATGMWDMVTHPQRTAETLVDAAQGGVDRIMPEEFTNFMDTYVSPRSPETRERQRLISGAVGQALKDRYWGLENLKNTMITDPVGIALDMGGIATGGLGLVRGPLTLGSKARLAEAPAAVVDAARPVIKEFSPTISAGDIGPAASATLNPVKSVIHSSKSPMMYNPIPKPQRGFDLDYSKEAIGNATGRLKKDIGGRPLTAPRIAGRRMVGEPDSPLTTAEIGSIGEETVREGIKRVTPSHIRGRAGLAIFDKYSGAPISVQISKGHTSSQEEKVLAHEVAHVVHKLVGNIPTKGIERELDFIYNALNTGQERTRNLTRPEHRGYTAAEAPDERIAEALRGYFVDPNWIKTVAPKTAARLREFVNSHPVVSKIVQLNSLAAGALGLALAGQSEDSKAAEAPRKRDSQTNFLGGMGTPPGSPFPFEPARETTKEDVNGLAELTKALSRRGLHVRTPKNQDIRNLTRALIDLEARKYGGPR